MTSALELEGLVSIVTGGSRGIGRGIAQALAEGGAVVAVVDLDSSSAASAAAELPGHNSHAGFACDVACPDQVNACLSQIEQALGAVDVLVNNAGITRDNLLMRMKDEEFDQVIAVNLKGTFNFTRAVARGMMKRRSGAIVNIASVVGLRGNAGQVNYAASKAGVIGLTKSVAREFASRGIRCNAIAPGFIRTTMTDQLTEAQKEPLMQQIPLGVLGEVEQIAGVARFLVGPAASYITGQTLAVDGGMVM
jgi:3-oxoacyl-[acyl-carrier protein] reductase